MSEKKVVKKSQVNLKRQVMVKAVVTEQFKEYLNFELTETVKMYSSQIQQIDQQLATMSGDTPMYIQLTAEKEQYQAYIANEGNQRNFVAGLELGSYYSQGPVDGFVSVSVGDNLYEKIGGSEIIVENGIVKSIGIIENFKPGMKIEPPLPSAHRELPQSPPSLPSS